MTGYVRLCGSTTDDLGGGLQEVWHRLGGHPHPAAATPASTAAGDGNDPAARERARLRRKASMHGQVASWISELTQGNTARCEDLRQRLAALRVLGGSPAGAALEQEIATLDRIVAWQLKTVDWHLAEACRLRDQEARINGPGDPAAAPVPGQTINAETARQPGGCGQTGGA